MNSNDWIIACSSGNTANVAISIIRLSGKNFLSYLKNFFTYPIDQLEANRAVFTKLVFQENILDEVVITFFKGPHSYNGEDILEISCHGNRLNIERIIQMFVDSAGFRRAKPGEFTERALKNGKLNLSQVEGLDLLLNATSIFSLDQGFSLLSGDLQKDFLKLQKSYLKHRSAIEIGFDFLDDIGESGFDENFKNSLNELDSNLNALYTRAIENTDRLIQPEIVLFGPPNAGKSTLFNQIVDSERAIVSKIEGTTRDFITESIFIEGNQFKLIDTAGIRITSDEIENEGIKKAKTLAEKAFYKILLIDPNTDYQLEEFKDLNFDLCLVTHTKGTVNSNLKGLIETGPIEPLKTAPIGPIYTIDLLETNVRNWLRSAVASKYQSSIDFNPVLIERHRDSIKNIYHEFQNYKDLVRKNNDLAILSSEFNSVGNCISELIGIVSPDEILENIFNNFCIGK